MEDPPPSIFGMELSFLHRKRRQRKSSVPQESVLLFGTNAASSCKVCFAPPMEGEINDCHLDGSDSRKQIETRSATNKNRIRERRPSTKSVNSSVAYFSSACNNCCTNTKAMPTELNNCVHQESVKVAKSSVQQNPKNKSIIDNDELLSTSFCSSRYPSCSSSSSSGYSSTPTTLSPRNSDPSGFESDCTLISEPSWKRQLRREDTIASGLHVRNFDTRSRTDSICSIRLQNHHFMPSLLESGITSTRNNMESGNENSGDTIYTEGETQAYLLSLITQKRIVILNKYQPQFYTPISHGRNHSYY